MKFSEIYSSKIVLFAAGIIIIGGICIAANEPVRQAVLGQNRLLPFLPANTSDADTIQGKTIQEWFEQNPPVDAATLAGHNGLYYLQAGNLIGKIANEHFSAYENLVAEGKIADGSTITTDANTPNLPDSTPTSPTVPTAPNTATHDPVSILDSITFDFTISGQQISGSVIQSGLKTSLISNDAGFISSLIAFTTSNLAEGSNLYWTQGRFNAAFGSKSTTNLAEGDNLYFTQGRFNTAFGNKTTDQLAEGSTNLYSQWATVLGGLSFVGGNVGIGTTSTDFPLTINGPIGTVSEGDVFRQYDGDSDTVYPIFARYWDGHTTYGSGTFIFGNGPNAYVSMERPGGSNLDLFRVMANSSTFNGAITIAGTTTLSGFTTSGGLLYTNASGVISQLAAGSTGQCLKSTGGVPAWGACASGDSITGSGTTGQLAFFDSSSTLAGGSGLTWDPDTSTLTITGNITMSGSIIPSADITYDLGSPTMQWKDVYIGPGSLYINGQKVLQESGESIIVSADPDQNLVMQTTNTGDIEFAPLGSGAIQLKGNVLMTGGKTFRTSDNSAPLFSDGVQAGNLLLSGNIFSTANTNGDIEFAPNGNGDVYFSSGNVGIGTTNVGTAKLRVSGGNIILDFGVANNNYIGSSQYSYYLPNDNGGRGGINAAGSFYINLDSNNDSNNAAFKIDKDSNGFSGGSNLLTVNEAGQITLPSYATNGGLLLTNASGVVSQSSAGTAGQCLQSAGGGAPTWGACAAANTVTGTGASGQVAFWNGANSTTGSSSFLWNNANSRLSLGTNTAQSGTLAMGNGDFISWRNQAKTGDIVGLQLYNGGFSLGNGAIQGSTPGGINTLYVQGNNGNVGIGQANPTNKLEVVSAGTTSHGVQVTANALTTGKGLNISSTSTAMTTGGLLGLSWMPGSATTMTGDLFAINVGPNGTVGNLLNLMNDGLSVFSVSQSQIVANVPVSFRAAGNMSVAYDLVFTNSTSVNIDSAGPLRIQAGEIFNSSDLTLGTYNNGAIVFDSAVVATNNDTKLGLGVYLPTARLSLAADTVAAGGIAFGTDTNLYRSAVDTLRTDDLFISGGGIAWAGTAAPSLSAAGNAKSYFDSTSNTLKLSENGGSFADVLSAGRAIQSPLDTKTAAYTITASDSIILVDTTGGAFAITLPSAAGITGKQYTIKQMSAADFATIETAGSETIDGAANYTFSVQYESVTVASDGANWVIISQK